MILDDATRDSWRAFFAQDGRFEVRYDAERFRRIAAKNLRDGVLLLVVVTAVLVAAVAWGRTGPIVLAALLFVVGAILGIVLLRRRLALLRPAGGQPGLLLGVSNIGLHTPLVPLVDWSEVRAVFAVDESARTARRLARPGLAGTAARWAAGNGGATRHLWFLLEDAPALRSRVVDQRWVRGFETFPNVDGPAFAQYVLDLDTVLSPRDTDRITAAVLVQAQARGIHAVESSGAADFAEYASLLSGVAVDGVVPDRPTSTTGNPFRS
ncbi:hypothetical protein JOE58_002362 [Curtobacterium luteum]|uniref:Uncharacterized protein n=1 Tax=Curtobacterium luteum TaxID=33881 RepID=A0A8H9G8G0_9MICO|nr:MULTISPECIES: hypothetical protein [Curtobacterium]MBM7803111.1 hypothetical protein [Curtobacterium luteum]NUU50762.1 hypothetical protein [Curtobacterium luteum]GGK94145.1 hypothetical protein GCM10009769_10200 [Curtobacterium luteum]